MEKHDSEGRGEAMGSELIGTVGPRIPNQLKEKK